MARASALRFPSILTCLGVLECYSSLKDVPLNRPLAIHVFEVTDYFHGLRVNSGTIEGVLLLEMVDCG